MTDQSYEKIQKSCSQTAYWCCGTNFPMELPTSNGYMENCSRSCCRLYICTQAIKVGICASLMTCLQFGEVYNEVGLSPGVLDILRGLGPDAGALLVSHPDVDKVAFTGSSATGSKVMPSTAQLVKLLNGLSLVFFGQMVKYVVQHLDSCARIFGNICSL